MWCVLEALDLISHFNSNSFSCAVTSGYHIMKWKFSLLSTTALLQIASFLLVPRLRRELRWRGDAESVTLPKTTVVLKL